MNKIIKQSIFSGMMVGIGVIVNTIVDNKYIGAMLFSLALLTIIACDLKLYTGKIGFVGRVSVKDLFIMFCGNLFGVYVAVFSVSLRKPELLSKVQSISDVKFQQTFYGLFVMGVFCGILMFVAVYTKNQLITVFCIMVFILSGFEHCVADFPYLLMNWSMTNVLKFLGIVFGNSVGSIFAFYTITEKDTP